MNILLNELTDKILIDNLENVIDDPMIFSSFVRFIKIYEVTQKDILLQVENEASLITLETYIEKIEDTIEKISGKKINVSLIINDGSHKISKKNVNEFSEKLTFDNYVSSDFNLEVVKISSKIIEKPGNYSPLFIHARSGLGKTHLLHAIGNEFFKKGLYAKYIDTNKFTNRITQISKENGNISKFAESFDEYDVLIFDDIQNLGDRTVSLKVLFNIINNHIIQNKQIVIASDKNPRQLTGFEDRFITRFESGFTTLINEPSVSDFVKILKFKLKELEIEPEKWDKDALEFVAINHLDSIRSLEGAIKRIEFHFDTDTINNFSSETIKKIFKNLTLDIDELSPIRIINVVAKYYQLTKDDLVGKSKKQGIVLARHMAVWFLRKYKKMNYKQIGRVLGNRDHSTIMSAERKIENSLNKNKTVKYAINKLSEKIKTLS